jgi:glycosyltransferase involved in cell wall biosynthesis
MKIALIGSRGVPANYGGFETFIQELGRRLAQRGHEVTVYCRSGYYKTKRRFYQGMRLVYHREPKKKALETLLSTSQALLHSLGKGYDIHFVVNTANSPLLFLPQILGKCVVLHLDGLEWQRIKWTAAGKRYFQFAEWLCTKLTATLISDSREIQKYYFRRYKRKTRFISYGAALQTSLDRSLLDRFSLKPGQYFLQITRFEPENNPLLSIQAFEDLETDKVLVLVGGARYKTDYTERMKEISGPRVRFLGYIYNEAVRRELLCNCYAYVHGNEVGGTNPALLEAMASGCFVVCRDVSFNREVLQEAGIYYRKSAEDLHKKLSWTIQAGTCLEEKRKKAKQIIKENYSWKTVVDAYESLFRSLQYKK